MHRVRSVTDHNAVDPSLDLGTDGLGKFDVLLGAHVLGEDPEQLLRREVADVCQLGNSAVELAGGERGNDGAGAVVEARSDRPPGSQ